MKKDINFSQGVTLTPYSDMCTDNELALLHGLEVYNGSIRPSTIDGDNIKFPSGCVIMCRHTTSLYDHFIVKYTDGNLYWYDTTGSSETPTSTNIVYSPVSTIVKIQTMGNFLIILTVDHIEYIRWIPETSKYEYMGNKIPEIPIQFALKYEDLDSEIVYYEGTDPVWELNFKINIEEEGSHAFDSSDSGLTSKVKETLAWMASNAISKNKFCFPFFLKFCATLYDGSHVNVSPSIFMVPSMRGPRAFVDEYETETLEKTGTWMTKINKIRCNSCSCSLLYRYTSSLESFLKWSDIIESIDIYVSQQIYTQDYDKNIVSLSDTNQNKSLRETEGLNTTGFKEYERIHDICVCDRYDITYSDQHHSELNLSDFYRNVFDEKYEIDSIQREESDIIDDIKQTSTFYLIKTIKLEQVDENVTDFAVLPLENGTLESIGTQTDSKYTLTKDDSSVGHYPILSGDIFVYNNRLNIYDTKISLENVIPNNHYFCFQDAKIKNITGYNTVEYDLTTYEAEIYISLSDKNISAEMFRVGDNSQVSIGNTHLLYFYYPDERAKVARIYLWSKTNSNGEQVTRTLAGCLEISLKSHDFWDGAYWFYDFDFSNCPAIQNVDYPEVEIKYDISINTVYTSKQNNPFVFPTEGINQVGSGRILALSTLSKPLSTGQHGDFDIMAFCTDGNYALSISRGTGIDGIEAGLIKQISMMTRDVCINASSVTQIDGAILFVSNRGLMVAAGNEIKCITEEMNGPVDTFVSGFVSSLEPLRDYLSSDAQSSFCIAWDYTSQRAMIMKVGSDKAWVRSFQTGTWSSIDLTIQPSGAPRAARVTPLKVINQYPYSYIQWNDYSVTILNDDYNFTSGEAHEGYLITRPLKLDTLQLKTLNEFAVNGIFAETTTNSSTGAVTTNHTFTLYGSMDAKTWVKIGSTTHRRVPRIVGRWYKYFRYVIHTTKLSEDENFSGITMDYTPRTENRIR